MTDEEIWSKIVWSPPLELKDDKYDYFKGSMQHFGKLPTNSEEAKYKCLGITIVTKPGEAISEEQKASALLSIREALKDKGVELA